VKVWFGIQLSNCNYFAESTDIFAIDRFFPGGLTALQWACGSW